MASKELGQAIDIHSGGIDLAFPHHENEVAQAEAYYHHEHSSTAARGGTPGNPSGSITSSMQVCAQGGLLCFHMSVAVQDGTFKIRV